MIYAITDGTHFKIGMTQNIGGRLCDLQTGNPAKLRTVAVLDFTDWFGDMDLQRDRDFEADLHAFLAEHRLAGEWFDGDAPKVKAIVELIKGQHWPCINAMICEKLGSLELGSNLYH